MFGRMANPTVPSRLATLCGTFCEIRHFCSDGARTIAAALFLCIELELLQCPLSVIRDALFRQTMKIYTYEMESGFR
jgi:hypothetical protein